MTVFPIETEHLHVAETDGDDLPALLAVRTSNPDRLLRTEGADGEPGRYDLDMLGRDLMIAGMDPARTLATVRERDSGEVVGLLDVLAVHPEDGHPWIGAVEVARERQRRRIGTEVVEAAVTALRGDGAAVRARVDDDPVARAFARACGFTEGAHGVWERT